jgi:opacity protein-like surface antigen
MIKTYGSRSVFGVGALAVAGMLATPADAEAQSREGRWQFFVPITFNSGISLEGEGGSSLDLNDDVGWGFGFGYHLNDQFMIGFEGTWMSANYEARIPVDEDGDGTEDGLERIGGRLDAGSFLGVGQFNLLQGRRFTPFVQGKLGWSYSDSNIASAPPQGVCWWDPWRGYICDVWQPTYSTWSFTYGVGAGIRAQLAPRFFLEGSYNGVWVDYDQETPRLDGFRLSIGWTN